MVLTQPLWAAHLHTFRGGMDIFCCCWLGQKTAAATDMWVKNGVCHLKMDKNFSAKNVDARFSLLIKKFVIFLLSLIKTGQCHPFLQNLCNPKVQLTLLWTGTRKMG